jgi:hypothetical protein
MYLQKRSYSISFIVLILLGFFFSSGKEANAQTKLRIGVFDSRAVAIAFYQSKFSNTQQIFGSLHTKMKEAKEKDDKEAIAKIEREATLRQAMMHQQGFGDGSVNNITETIKDKMAQLAKNENLSAIVSKWEMVFSGADIELVDITVKVVDFFEPNEKMKEMTKEVMQSEPIKDAYLIDD